MLIVLPFYVGQQAGDLGDIGAAKDLLALIRELGGAPAHDLLIARRGVPDFRDFLPLANGAFRSVSTLAVDGGQAGWPRGCNFLFRSIATHVATHEPFRGKPWLFLEPDCVPLVAGWADQLDAAYRSALSYGKPYLGRIIPTMLTDLKTGERVQRGCHLSGVSVYPWDFALPRNPAAGRPHTSDMISFCDEVAWDVYCQMETVPWAMETDLIHHAWHSGNYRTEGEGLVCDSLSHLFQCEPPPPEAILIHGCKDNSLRQWVRAGLRAEKEANPPPPPPRRTPRRARMNYTTVALAQGTPRWKAIEADIVAGVKPKALKLTHGINRDQIRRIRRSLKQVAA